MVHFSLKCRRVNYYNSLLARKGYTNRIHWMQNWYRKTIDDMRRRSLTKGVSLRKIDPEMNERCNIRQKDHHSCGPPVMREIEILIGIDVEDDPEDPIRIRL